jgi:hypothetical protein
MALGLFRLGKLALGYPLRSKLALDFPILKSRSNEMPNQCFKEKPSYLLYCMNTRWNFSCLYFLILFVLSLCCVWMVWSKVVSLQPQRLQFAHDLSGISLHLFFQAKRYLKKKEKKKKKRKNISLFIDFVF